MSLYFYKKKQPVHPELSFFSFDLHHLLGQLRERLPESSSHQIGVWIQSQPTLACIEVGSPLKAIVLHSVLNHRQTPEEVISFIIGHELVHLVIPPREVDGRLTAHPPEFWEAEGKLFPERDLAWSWVHLMLGLCLKEDKEAECIFVKRCWKKLMGNGRSTLGEVAEICHINRISPAVEDNHFL
jgi:hypothetical protein